MAPCTTYCEKINFSWVSKLSSRCGSWYYVRKHFFFFGGGGGVNLDNENGENRGDNIILTGLKSYQLIYTSLI